jgi:hypothetical protein
MCSLCGNMGVGRDWADEAKATGGTATLERQHRMQLAAEVLRPAGLTLRQWGGRYQLLGATGRSELVDTLSGLWPAADRLGRRALDPLDPGLLNRLEQRS